MTKNQNKINIKNRRASFEFEFIETFVAGIKLSGTEIKSIRDGQASINEAFCTFINDELFIRNMHIAEYSMGTYANHEPKRDRKLLLKKKELEKMQSKMEVQGLTIIPLRLFIADSGFAKLEIALAKGKKIHDKRDSIKDRDVKRDLDRIRKSY